MHPYLTRLKVPSEVQEFFAPFYCSDDNGDLLIRYGNELEHYGMAFHRIPTSNDLWKAGQLELSQVRQVFICSSAMEAIAFLSFRYERLVALDQLLFVSTGTKPIPGHIDWLRTSLRGKRCFLVQGNDLLGRISAIKLATGLLGKPVAITAMGQELFRVSYRYTDYYFEQESLTLSAFQKATGFRSGISTCIPLKFDSFFAQLKFNAFK